MKLLLDENIAPSLVARLADIFPACEHVRDVGLAARDDLAVWESAQIETIVRENAAALEAFDGDPVASMLVVTA